MRNTFNECLAGAKMGFGIAVGMCLGFALVLAVLRGCA